MIPLTGGPARSVPYLGEAIKKAGAEVQIFVDDKGWGAINNGRIIPSFSPVRTIKELRNTLKELREKKMILH